jgi:transcriptional regulator
MYIPKHFEETRIEVLTQHIAQNALATIVTHHNADPAQGLNANHIPLEWVASSEGSESNQFGFLRGHVARANSLINDLQGGGEHLVVFQGPTLYMSPSLYATKQTTHKVVPTWNYAVVHAYGSIKLVDDSQWLRQLLAHLTAQHEANRSQPWSIDDAPTDYMQALMKAIVGIEMRVERFLGKWKVSQNQPEQNKTSIISELSVSPRANDQNMANIVKKFGY